MKRIISVLLSIILLLGCSSAVSAYGPYTMYLNYNSGNTSYSTSVYINTSLNSLYINLVSVSPGTFYNGNTIHFRLRRASDHVPVGEILTFSSIGQGVYSLGYGYGDPRYFDLYIWDDNNYPCTISYYLDY